MWDGFVFIIVNRVGKCPRYTFVTIGSEGISVCVSVYRVDLSG